MQFRNPPPPLSPDDWAFFLDLDGTLVELADTPEGIHLAPSTLELIGKLHRASGGALALVSGRTLADLEKRIGGLPLAMAGQHGLERRDAAGRLRVQAGQGPALASIARHLAGMEDRHAGLLLEDKGHSLAIHYRQAPRLAGYVHRTVRELISGSEGRLRLQKGKKVVEIRPAGSDKGKAIAAYMEESPFRGRRPVFIGDDVTDEDGFAMVNRLRGLSIKVGPGPTCAHHRLADVAAVAGWMAACLGAQDVPA